MDYRITVDITKKIDLSAVKTNYIGNIYNKRSGDILQDLIGDPYPWVYHLFDNEK